MSELLERTAVSTHEVAVYLAFSANPDKWMSNKDVGEIVKGVKPRTVRAHTLKLVKLGLLDQAEVFPARRYRWSVMADKRNIGYARRLKQAAEVFGHE